MGGIISKKPKVIKEGKCRELLEDNLANISGNLMNDLMNIDYKDRKYTKGLWISVIDVKNNRKDLVLYFKDHRPCILLKNGDKIDYDTPYFRDAKNIKVYQSVNLENFGFRFDVTPDYKEYIIHENMYRNE